MSSMRKRPSASDVAEKAGVSTATVSHVFSGRKNATVPETTRRRVLDAAALIDYRPNRIASGLARGKAHLVGLVCRLDTFESRIAALIRDELTRLGYQVLLTRSAEHFELEQAEVQMLLEYQVDALICITGGWAMEDTRPWLAGVAGSGIPCVIVNDIDPSGQLDSIVSDNFEGALNAVRHLREKGHTRIGHIPGGDIYLNGLERRQGYLAGLWEAGLTVDPLLIQSKGYEVEAGYVGAMRLLALADPPTAITAGNDTSASGVYHAIRDRGLRVPEDIAIVGFGNERESQALRMTTVHQFPEEMGRTAVERVMSRLRHPNMPIETLRVRTELISRLTS
jgi:LacI family transcriptional regulator